MDKALDIINAELTGIFDNIIRAEAASVSNEYKEKLSMTEVHTIAAIGTGTLKSMGEVAKALLRMGQSIEFVVQATGMTIEQVRKIKEE